KAMQVADSGRHGDAQPAGKPFGFGVISQLLMTLNPRHRNRLRATVLWSRSFTKSYRAAWARSARPRARRTAMPASGCCALPSAGGWLDRLPLRPVAGDVAPSAGSAGPAPTGAAGGRPRRSPAGTARWRATLRPHAWRLRWRSR